MTYRKKVNKIVKKNFFLFYFVSFSVIKIKYKYKFVNNFPNIDYYFLSKFIKQKKKHSLTKNLKKYILLLFYWFRFFIYL